MPRPLLSFALAAVLSPLASAQWQPDGNDLYFDGGRVGVGIAPSATSLGGSLYVDSNGSGTAVVANCTGYGTGLRALTETGVGLSTITTGDGGSDKALFASCASDNGYAGYFLGGKSYFGGNLGIGAQHPLAKLHVKGNQGGMVLNADNQFFVNGDLGFVGVDRSYRITSSEVFGLHAMTNGYGGMYANTSGWNAKPFYGYATGGGARAYHYYDGGTQQWILNVGGVRMTINRSNGFMQLFGGASKPGGGSWSVLSDRRLKTDVRDLEGSLERLLGLRGVTYEYLQPEELGELTGRQTGMIAQEVEERFPGWVDEGEDGYKRITFRGFEAVAVEALRELRAEKDSEIRLLQLRNARLEDRLARLEAAVFGK